MKLKTVVPVVVLCLAAFLIATVPVIAQPPDVTVVLITGAFDESTRGLANAGDGSGRIFSIAQNGLIEIWNGTQVLAQPFLDIGALVSTGGEEGLLGLAFHPNYTVNGFFYVYYIDLSGDSVVARYSVSANANIANPVADSIVLTFNQPAGNHNGGDLHFGPDGYLYISSGDGGSDWCAAQDVASLLGKILRIDVDGDDFPLDANANYAIPAANPFVGVAGAAAEIWAMGLRNPWRFSIDRLSGDLFIGDVGEDGWEEFDRLSAGVGGVNFGWPWFEGVDAFSSCAEPLGGPFTTCASGPFTCPILALDHTNDNACSSIGGYRYAGDDYPGLRGVYFYTDWCEGEIHAAALRGSSWTPYDVSTQGFGVTSFGEDEDGELYFVNGPTLYQITGDGFTIFADGFEGGDTLSW